MAQNYKLSSEQWERYTFMRDNGHEDFVRLADKCGQYLLGRQWDQEDIARLRAAGRPHITINEVLPTVAALVGEQVTNQAEATFRPRYGKATAEIAATLAKVYKHILTDNQAKWRRTDIFEDGVVTGRGFYDVRLDFTDSLTGEVRITRLNPKNVILAPDTTEYDPDKWPDVVVSKWMTPAEIEVLYGKAKADLLRTRQVSSFFYGYDSLDQYRDRTASNLIFPGYNNQGYTDQDAYIRVLDRQYRKVVRRKFFADMRLGDVRPVPDDWNDARITEYLMANTDVSVIERGVQRIRWTVTADDVVLHDAWSPYEYFTVIPYFPYFRDGQTSGIVQQLLSIQDLLNKSVSQELHIVNTTANSGWKVKKGSLLNMTVDELELRGAETGLVVEVDDPENIEKITPNAVPSGIDRLSVRAENFVTKVSSVSSYMRGEAREDVSARALERNEERGLVSMARMLDNLERTDFFLARTVLSLVQNFYTEERLLNITTDALMGEYEQVMLNEVTPEGQILNDLTIGEYDIVITTTPSRDSLEDSEFEQASALRELGIPISDERMVLTSRLLDKADVIREMREAAESPQAQMAQQLQLAQAQAQLANVQADTAKAQADAQNKAAQAEYKATQAQQIAMESLTDEGVSPDLERIDIERTRVEGDLALRREEMAQNERLEREKIALDREKMRRDDATKRATAAMQAQSKPQGENS